MENQRIQILDQIRRLETGGILGSDDPATISHLKEQYNETVQNIYRNTPGLFWDIIQVFPEEIWIQIIQHALPSTYYSAALLTLTIVSSTWLRALTSTPLLWAYLEICGSDQDSLATLSTFTHLSRETSLTVTIYSPLRHDTRIIHSILYSMGDRIRKIALVDDKRGELPSHFSDPAHYYADIEFLADTLKYTPNVSVLDFRDGIMEHKKIVLEKLIGSLPPLLRAIHSLELQWPLEQLLPLTQMRAYGTANSWASHLGRMPQLQSLALNIPYILTFGEERGPVDPEFGKQFSKLSKLTSLLLDGAFRFDVLDLLTAVAQNLVDIDLTIPFPQFPDILNILSSCIRLRTLSLCLREYWFSFDEGDDAVPNLAPSSSITSIRSLKSLTLKDVMTNIGGEPAVRRKGSEQMTTAITSIIFLFSEVEEVYLSLRLVVNQEDIARILKRLSEIPNLKRLSLTVLKWSFMWNQPQSTVLRRLEELDHPLPIPFTAPRLLSAQWTPGADHPDSMSEYDNVRTLHVNDTDRRPHWIKFPHGSLPRLINLKLRISGSQHLRLGSFLALASISIISGPAGATSLCIAILYQQEACPHLTEIEFFQNAPEWDILFIMLERRNFPTNRGVLRIRRVSLPCIPNSLRAPLTCLLRGLYTTRPKNEDLSFDGIIDLVFDKQITGCFNCLRSMLGPCKEPVLPFSPYAKQLDALTLPVYSTVDNPPPLHLDPAIVEWIHRREIYTLVWKSAVEDKGPQCWRKATCPRYASSRVEITEHDVD